MFTKKVDRHWSSLPRWSFVAFAISGAAVAWAQGISGPAAPPASRPAETAPAEQRLFPNGLPKFEVLLKAALDHHPDVLAARSKLRSAEVERRMAELKAVKDMMAVRERWEKAHRENAFFVAQAGKRGANDPELRESLVKLAAIEWELAFLLGMRGEPALAAKDGAEKDDAARQVEVIARLPPGVVESAVPRGRKSETLKFVLNSEIEVNVESLPLIDVVKYLNEHSGIRFVLDRQSLEGDGLPVDHPIDAALGRLELGAALQAIEDLNKPLQFVVRDYGILVTSESQRSSETVAARDFWKLTEEELRDKLLQQRQEELLHPGLRAGGMGMGGVGAGLGGLF